MRHAGSGNPPAQICSPRAKIVRSPTLSCPRWQSRLLLIAVTRRVAFGEGVPGPSECVAYPKWHRPLCESGGTTSALCGHTCVHVTPAHLGAPRGRRDTDQVWGSGPPRPAPLRPARPVLVCDIGKARAGVPGAACAKARSGGARAGVVLGLLETQTPVRVF